MTPPPALFQIEPDDEPEEHPLADVSEGGWIAEMEGLRSENKRLRDQWEEFYEYLPEWVKRKYFGEEEDG